MVPQSVIDLVAPFRPQLVSATLADPVETVQGAHFSLVENDLLEGLGIRLAGRSRPDVFLTNRTNIVGSMRVDLRGKNSCLLIDNELVGGAINGNLTAGGDNSVFFLHKPAGVLTLGIISLRSNNQMFFVGKGSTAVHLSVEIEGDGKAVIIGEDALISSGVWVRNHDMHSVVDLQTRTVSNAHVNSMIIEPHVWIGQDSLILAAQRVGYGSIIGAMALVRSDVPAQSVVGGVPARLIRSKVSWGRSVSGISPVELSLLEAMRNKV